MSDTLDLDALINASGDEGELDGLPDLNFDLDTEAEVQDHEVPVPGRKRLSVSQLRDYYRCPRYYKLKRIDKLEEEKKHYLAAGNVVHNSFYTAYAFPVEEYDAEFDRMKVRWEVTGDFEPAQALAIYDLLYWRSKNEAGESQLDRDYPIGDLDRMYRLLDEDTPVVDNFTKGRKKALRADSQDKLREGWHEHYRDMLEKSLATPLPYPVVDIERKINFVLGGNPMVAYIDLVSDGSKDYGPGTEIFTDLKTGQNKPSTNEIYFDDQAATYYYAGGSKVQDFQFYYMNSGSLLAVDRNQGLIDTLPHMAEDAAINIQNEHYPRAFDKQKCSWCPFSKECLGI